MLLVGAGSVAVVSSQEASAQRDSATIEALVATALALRTSERDVSALLAAEAYRRWPDDPRTRSGLMSVLQGAGGLLGNAVVASSGTAYGGLIPGTENVLVVTSSGDAAVRDAETGDMLQSLDLGFEPGPIVHGPRALVELSADGRVGAVLWPAETQVAGVTSYGTSPQSDLVVFDLERAARIAGPIRVQAGTGALAVNSDGSMLAIADARDGAVTVMSTSDGRMHEILDEAPVALDRDTSAAALTFDAGDRLVVGRLDDRIDMIDPRSAMTSASMAVPASSAHVAMDVAESGVVVASGDRRLIAIDPDRGQVLWSTDITRTFLEVCTWLAISDAMQRVYCGSTFGRISVFDLTDGAALPDEGLGPVNGQVGTIDLTDDGTALTTISASQPVISRWSVDGGGIGHRLIAPGRMVVGPYSFEDSAILTAPQVAWTGPEQILDGAAVVDTGSGEVTFRYDEPVSGMGWLRGHRAFARSPAAEVFRVIDAETGEQVGKPIWGVFRYWPSPDGAKLVAVMADGRLQDADPLTGQLEGESWGVLGRPTWVSIAPDGDRIAVTHWSDGKASDLLDGTGSTQEGTWLAFVSADDHRLLDDPPATIEAHVLLDGGDLIALEGNRMRRYEIDPLARIGTVPGAAGTLGSPSQSGDGGDLLVMADDGTALFYDAPTGVRIGEPFHADPETLAPAVLRPDGLELALSMPDGVMIWDIDPEHQFEDACRIAGRDLTENEWRTYLGALGARQSTCGFAD